MTNSDEGANGRAWRMAAAWLAAGVPGWGDGACQTIPVDNNNRD
jgi:hypothetical protein